MSIKNYKSFNNVQEDKIYKFSEYDSTKYNSNIIITQIMEWLRAKLLNSSEDEINIPLNIFLKECPIDKNKFLTFYNELSQTQKIKNFKIQIIDNNIIFNNFRNNVDIDV